MMDAKEMLAVVLRDEAEDEQAIRDLCKRVLPADVVDGDSYGVPSIVDLVEMLVEKLEELSR